VLHNQVGIYENFKVEWVPGATPTLYLYGPEKRQISQQEVGDKDLKEVLQMLNELGFVPLKKQVDMGQPVRTKTFGTSVYELYTTSRNFLDAKEFAESVTLNGVKGHLPTVTSKEQHDAIVDLLQASTVETVWLGGSDAETEGKWKWVSGPHSNTLFWDAETPIQHFVSWGVNEPNNVNKEDCVSISKDGNWNDNNCDSSFLSVVVEYSTNTASTQEGEENKIEL